MLFTFHILTPFCFGHYRSMISTFSMFDFRIVFVCCLTSKLMIALCINPTPVLACGSDDRTWDFKKKSLALQQTSLKFHSKQRLLPRRVWVARAELYHASRSRACGWTRKRSARDDELIYKLVDFALSPYVRRTFFFGVAWNSSISLTHLSSRILSSSKACSGSFGTRCTGQSD